MSPSPLPPDHVLIVDDDLVVLHLLQHTLRAGGFDVTAVATGSTALLALCAQRERIGWLVTPIALPGLVDGWLLVDEYHQHHPHRPALFVADQVLRSGSSPVRALALPPFAPLRVLEALKTLSPPERVKGATHQSVA